MNICNFVIITIGYEFHLRAPILTIIHKLIRKKIKSHFNFKEIESLSNIYVSFPEEDFLESFPFMSFSHL